MTKILFTILVALALVGSLAAPSGAYQRPGKTERVSAPIQQALVPPTGQCSGGAAGGPDQNLVDVTPDGRHVAFASTASDLIEGDRNLACDAFVKDRRSGEITRVSVSTEGDEATIPSLRIPVQLSANSTDVSISANGRYIAFSSVAQDLVPGDTNQAWDVFVHDIRKRTTRRASVSSTGDEGTTADPVRDPGDSTNASISANGRYVAFTSDATNLVEKDTTENRSHVFVHDLRTRRTVLASIAPEDRPDLTPSGMGINVNPSISGDGRYVAFYTVGGNEHIGIHVRDLRKAKTYEIDVVSGETYRQWGHPFANAQTQGPAARQISADGRFVVFQSPGRHLIPNDGNLAGDTFIHDLETGRTERVSVEATGEEHPGGGGSSAISPDGRFVSFSSTSEQSGAQEVYIHDRKTGALEIISVNMDGTLSRCTPTETRGSDAGALSFQGRHVAFTSDVSCLAEGDDLQTPGDIFLRDFGAPVGAGGLGGPPPAGDAPREDRICISPDICVPPGARVASTDEMHDVDELLTEQGADLYGASLAYRPQYQDLFAAIELEYMPTVVPGISPIFYGLRFDVGDKHYEVRATSLNYGTFGLFDCTDSLMCTQAADLRGGYGTTGMRVVFSVPLEQVGLQEGGELSDVEAFSGIGSHLTGAAEVLDSVRVK